MSNDLIARFPFLRNVNPAHPDEVRDDGRKVWNVRCKIPFTAPAGDVGAATREQVRAVYAARSMEPKDDRVFDDSGEGVVVQPDATGNPGDKDEVSWDDPMVMGVASSTSVDFYGTEMSLRALKQMAAQMMTGDGNRVGIPYLPRHSNGMSGPLEWDEVIGRTIHAEVIPQDEVRKAYNVAEQQFILRTTIKLFSDEPVAQAMLRRIARGERIGQSIGGWFTQLQVVQNEDGEVERVIVLGVELDHLAATRAPANPDSADVVQLRSAFAQRLQPQSRTAEQVQARAVTAFADLPLAPEDTEWTWDAEAQNAILDAGGWDAYRQAHLWVDPERAEVKDGYKLAIALWIDGQLHAVWNAVAAAMSVLNGGRGGVDIPDGDREPVYRHLVRYYEKFGKEPPPLAAASMLSAARAAMQQRHILSVTTEGEDVVVVRFAREHAIAEVEPMDADEATEEVEVEEPEAAAAPPAEQQELHQIAVTVDSVRRVEQDTSQSARPDDARGSATQPLTAEPEQEYVMPEQNGMTLDALSALLDAKLAPLAERVQQLESGSPKATVAPKGQITDLDAAIARAKAAEEKLATVLAQPNRVGRSQLANQIPTGPLAPTGLRGVVEQARVASRPAVTVAAVAERMIDAVTVQPGKAPANLRDHLAALLDAAMADGLLTNPADRSQWA